MNASEIGLEYPTHTTRGELTFLGGLKALYEEKDISGRNVGISRHWGEATQESYNRDYDQRLLPVMESLGLCTKALKEFSEEDFLSVLQELQNRADYARNTLQHYRYLLWVVYRAGFQHGWYDDQIFWGDLAPERELRDEERVKLGTQIPKSLPLEVTIRFLQWFQGLNPETATGEEVGVLLMFFQGLRDNESCGVDMEHLRLLEPYRDTLVLDVVQSTVGATNQVKSGGKTSNAPRILPVLHPFGRFLKERAAYVKEQLEQAKLPTDHVPFACRGNRYQIRCATPDITKTARTLFVKLGIDLNSLNLLKKMMMDEELDVKYPDIKTPTAYLLRRNFATMLYLMGFSYLEIQYLMGHEIEDPLVTRNMLSDVDWVHDTSMRLSHHPYMAVLEPSSERPGINAAPMAEPQYTAAARMEFCPQEGSPGLMTKLATCEPGAPLELTVHSDQPFNISVICTQSLMEAKTAVNVARFWEKACQKELEK